MMAASLAAAANAVAASAALSGSHAGVNLSNALMGLPGNSLPQASHHPGLINMNGNPLLYNNQVRNLKGVSAQAGAGNGAIMPASCNHEC